MNELTHEKWKILKQHIFDSKIGEIFEINTEQFFESKHLASKTLHKKNQQTKTRNRSKRKYKFV